MGLEAGDDEIAAPELVELFMQRGAGKGVGQPLVDDQLPLARCHRRVDRAARLVEVEEAAGLALVTNVDDRRRSEEHTSELQSLMRHSYAVLCLKKKKTNNNTTSKQ